MDGDGLPCSSRLAGISTTAELAWAGVTRATVRMLVRRGVLCKLDTGVYARAEPAAEIAKDPQGERLLRIAAAVAVVGPGAVASHHDAGIVHGLALLGRPPAGVLSVSRPVGAAGGRTGRPGIRVRACSLPADQVAVRNAVPVTSVARTVVDLARSTSFRAGVVVADCALHSGKTSKDELGAIIESCYRWPGIERARRVVEFSDPLSESPFESISRVAFSDWGLPAPELQVWVGGDGRQIGRADFFWSQHRTIAEADGAVKYADPDRARRQLLRDAELRDAGFEVVHFTWHELTAAPWQVEQSIRAAFRRAGTLRAAERPQA